ncbi:tetratricopeptide repeat protein [Rhodobacteraceae bacterium RKSG542]|uniref:tetratricopeptide repeat protein n=1 Tax=Pseudovibrio flavus TaxID=2529854 RepID=UPI0012BC6E5B|nr:tetratricopeptide repeat protein [Pseudovibrio flavus]MTI15812.1 tetratricopeptide repeat protein [Pseudovibrio flavus]
MQVKDNAGLSLSAASHECAILYDDAIGELMHWRNPSRILEAALKADPQFAMAEIFLAHMDLVSTDKRYASKAVERLQRIADMLSRGGYTPREAAHYKALCVWANGDLIRAAQLLDAILEEYPTDSLAVWMGHQIDFYIGDSKRIRDRIANVLPYWDREHPFHSFVVGMHAFGLEEAGESSKAKDVGLAVLESAPKDVWSIHAVAHAMEMLGEYEEGARFMEDRIADWSANNVLISHNAIHTILYRLEEGQLDRCLYHLDNFVMPKDRKAALLGLIDGSSALWRLHLDGVDTGVRMDELAGNWEKEAEHAFYAFNDIHAVMAFVGSDNHKAVADLITAQKRYLSDTSLAHETNYAVTREVGLPVCSALQAFGAGKYEVALDGLTRVRETLIQVGGSHAQRDAIERTILEAAIRGRNKRAAEQLVAERLRHKPRSPYNLKQQQRIALMR